MYDGITAQNAKTVESMTEDERERGKQEIVERFGLDIGERLLRARAAQRRADAEGEQGEPTISGFHLIALPLSIVPKESPGIHEPTPQMPVNPVLGGLRGALSLS